MVTGNDCGANPMTEFFTGIFSLSLSPGLLYWTCTKSGFAWICSPGYQNSTLQANTSVVAPSGGDILNLTYGCSSRPSNYCQPSWLAQPSAITIPSGQLTTSTTLSVEPKACSAAAGQTNYCYTY